MQRTIFDRISADPAPDALWVEEALLTLLELVLEQLYARSPAVRHQPQALHRRDAELVAAAQWVLSSRVSERVTLAALARRVGVSAFHLCRVFRRHTGTTLHGHQEQLRLRQALEWLPGCRDLTQLGLKLGFSSHSHFTLAFRRAFGTTPSVVARGLEGREISAAISKCRRSPQRARS